MVKYARIIQVTMLALTAILIVSMLPRWGEAQPNGGPEIKWAPDIKIGSAKDMKVHKVLTQTIDKDKFIALSSKVLERAEPNANLRKMVKLDTAKLDNGLFTYIEDKDPSSSITQDSKNGDIVFQNQMSRYLGMKAVNLLSKEAAITEAKRFIGDVGLKPTDFESNGKLLYTSNLVMQDCKDGVLGEKITKLQTLHFGREIDGIEVQGPGSRIVMQLGDQGRVVSLARKWNAIIPTQKLTPTGLEAIKDVKMQAAPPGATDTIKPAILPGIQKSMGKTTAVVATPYLSESEVKDKIIKDIRSDFPSADYVEVTDVSLVYYDRSGDYIQPAYAVEVILHWGEDATDYLFHIAALRKPAESISGFVMPGSEVMSIPIPEPPAKGTIAGQ